MLDLLSLSLSLTFFIKKSFRLQTNHLGSSLLVLLLLPAIRAAESKGAQAPRIVVVSSDAHAMTTFDEEILAHSTPLKRMSEADYCNVEYVFCSPVMDILI